MSAKTNVVLLLIFTTTAFGQAWLPPKGTTTVGVSYQYMEIRKHLAPPAEVDIGHVTSHAAVLDLRYSAGDRLAFSASVPYVSARYVGPDPHPFSDLDNGHYHGGWQDYRFEAQYQIGGHPYVISPFIGATLPMHDYAYFAHSARGRDLREESVGFYAGVGDLLSHFRRCGCPTGTYLESRVGYSFVEPVIGIRHDHLNADVDAGYFINDRLGVRALASYNYTFGGIPFDLRWYGNVEDPRFLHHDQIVAERHLNAGAGANYVISDRVDLFASALHMMWGRNGHKIHLAATAGISWSFAPKVHSNVSSVR